MSGPKYKIGDRLMVGNENKPIYVAGIQYWYEMSFPTSRDKSFQTFQEHRLSPMPLTLDEWAAMVAEDSVYQKEGDSLFFYERVAAAIKKHWESAP